jgi:hypothetical protein
MRHRFDPLVHFPEERLVLSHAMFACIHVISSTSD